ncbi:MAG: gamma-glutamylcyclotransferase [Desulfococcaceae bacterium]
MRPQGEGRGTARVGANPEDAPEAILRLFVCGAPKRGRWSHQRFCATAPRVEPAVVRGRLWHLHAGFPALEAPEGLILARGAADPPAGASGQQETGTPRFGRPTGDWDRIHGEPATFTDPQRDLPPVDRLEGFRPGGRRIGGWRRRCRAGAPRFLPGPIGRPVLKTAPGLTPAPGIDRDRK